MARHFPAGSSESEESGQITTRRRSTRTSASRRPSNPWLMQEPTGCDLIIDQKNLEAVDTKTGRIYTYTPRESRKSRNCDLFVLDVKTMKVKNLSDDMEYVDFSAPNPDDRSLPPKPAKTPKFPMIDFAAFAFMATGIGDCLVVFSGQQCCKEDQSDAKLSSDLYLIDVSEYTRPRWWRQMVEGKVGQPRMDATITVVGHRIYLFGGVDKPHEIGEEPGNIIRSYSIIENDPSCDKWRWVVSDAPYPDDFPPEIVFGRATAVENGKRILLMPGRSERTSFLANFTSDTMFYFCTKTHRFTKARVVNDDLGLPQGISSYHTTAFIPPPNKYTLGNNSKYPFASRQKRRLLFRPPASPESILLCGFPAKPNKHNKYTPELWRLFLFPRNRICFLKIEVAEDLSKFPAEFHYFTLIDRRIYLLGSEDEEDLDEEDIAATKGLLDFCVQMPLEPQDFDMDMD